MLDAREIGERLTQLRKERGLSQSELAEEVGVSDSTIGMYETGKRIPRDKIKMKLAEVLNADVGAIFFK